MDIKCFLIEPTGEQDEDGHYIWHRPDTGERFKKYHWPAGAIWRATWYEEFPEWTGSDGKSYCCMTPGGEWFIDGRASNCTLNDDAIHKCWCRHGEAPDFTVDKNGNTCSAGAGSILVGSYHGFLRNGYLTGC